MKNILIILFSPVLFIFRGFVLSKLWLWFIIPTFNLPELRIIPAIGLSLLVSLLTLQPNFKDSEEENYSLKIFFYGIFASGFALLIGYVWHLFI